MEKHIKLSTAVDVLVFTIADDELKVLLFRRDHSPFKGMYALPGVAVREDESLDDAAKRAVYERTGLSEIYFEQLYTFGAVGRDPRSRTISVAYYALTNMERKEFSKLSENAGLFSVEKILSGEILLAFDHREMIECARERLKGKADYTDIAFEFVPQEFTLPQLQRVYEIILGEKLYKANFRKMIAPKVEDTGKMLTGAAHRPSKLYTKSDMS